MAELFVTADQHIHHKMVVLYTRREPFIVPNPDYNPDLPKNIKTNWPETVLLDDHDDFMIDSWNSVVGKKDDVIVVGDYIWNREMHYFNRMNGRKHIVIGNHDKVSKKYLDKFESAQKYLDNFTSANEILSKTFEKRYRVIFSHCPYLSWPGSNWGSWNFHGHCHGRLKEYPDVLRTDVGVDVWNYKPVHIDILIKKMKDRYPAWKERRRNRDVDQVEDWRPIQAEENLKYLD